jgi:hypothetical protein
VLDFVPRSSIRKIRSRFFLDFSSSRNFAAHGFALVRSHSQRSQSRRLNSEGAAARTAQRFRERLVVKLSIGISSSCPPLRSGLGCAFPSAALGSGAPELLTRACLPSPSRDESATAITSGSLPSSRAWCAAGNLRTPSRALRAKQRSAARWAMNSRCHYAVGTIARFIAAGRTSVVAKDAN